MAAKGWEPAGAKIVARRESSKFACSSLPTRKRYEYAVEISPSDGTEPFRATMVTPMRVDRWLPLEVGKVVTVLFNAKTREVKFDKAERSTSRKADLRAFERDQKRSDDEAFDAALRSKPGHGPHDH